MKKIFTIAAREYRAMVGTKAFLLSIVMMPVLMLGSLLAIELLKNAGEIKQRKIAIIDHSGVFADTLVKSAVLRNSALDAFSEANKSEQAEGQSNREDLLGESKDRYEFEVVELNQVSDDLRVALSERIRNQDLYAFIEIPKSATNSVALKNKDGGTGPASEPAGEIKQTTPSEKIRFYAQDSSLSEARRWISQIINEQVRTERLAAADIDPAIVRVASQPVPIVGMGLVEQANDGSINSKEEDDPMSAIFLPMGVMMLMFMVIFMAAQPMLESVLEEKSQRIAEVLLGSANPFQLMCGKLLGTVAGSLTVFTIYFLGSFGFAMYKGYADVIPIHLAPWFVVFQVMGVLFYAAIFLAIGASVTQLKEAQSLLLPVWMLMMSPMFVWIFIVRDPLGSMATYFSLFPPATPTAMMLRMATGQTIPIWQPILGLVLTAASTLLIVVIAARIFRVGILWQGKTPKITEIIKWAITG